MATKKKITEVAEEVKAAAAEAEAKVEAAVEPAKEKVEKAVKKAEPAVKKARTAVKKAAEKTTETAKKAVRAAKASIYVQFAGREVSMDDVFEAAKKDYMEKTGAKAADFKNVDIYVKPEENAAYYVVNGEGREEYRVEL